MRWFDGLSVRSVGLIGLSAILQIVIFPTGGPEKVWLEYLGWIAFVPLLYLLLAPTEASGKSLTPGQGGIAGYLCGFIWYAGNCSWIYQTMYRYGGLPKTISFGILVLFALYLGLYHALFGFLLTTLRRRSGSLAALSVAPFLWVAIELARARITGFPWDLLGNSQIDSSVITQAAPFAGVMSISFMVFSGNCLITGVLFLPLRRVLRLAVLPACCVIALSFAALKRSSKDISGLVPSYAVLCQENLSVGAEGREDAPLAPADELAAFSNATLDSANSLRTMSKQDFALFKSGGPAVLVWPEAPSHLRSDSQEFRSAIAKMARAANAPAIIGSLGIDWDKSSPRGYREYDSASLFDASGIYRGRYDKIHLVPWGEYVPFKRFFSFAEKLTEGVGDMDAGVDRRVFNEGGHRYGVFICYESIFGDEVRQFVKNGAEVLVNISDDGWYGETGAPWQHLNMARMRAIENDRWILRATNTGVTTAIDPDGRMQGAAPRHVRGAFVFPFQFVDGTTFYTRHGDWFAWLCVMVSCVVFAWSIASKRSDSHH